MNMEYAVNLLKAERENLVAALKRGEDRRDDLRQLDSALKWLALLEKSGAEEANKYDIEQLPCIDGMGGFAALRLVAAPDFGDKQYWEEYVKPDGKRFELSYGDFILVRKQG